MARKFVRASTQYLEFAGAVLTATPLTFACWFSCATASTAQTLMGLYKSTGTTSAAIYLDLDATNHVRCNDGGSSSSTSTTYSTNTWTHAAMTGSNAGPTYTRNVWLNAAGNATGTNTFTASGLNVTSIGRLSTSTPTNYFNGSIAEAGIWNVVLTLNEITALAQGLRPRFVRPRSLVAYWPLFGLHSPEVDLSGTAQNMVITGATASNHAPVSLFTRKARTPFDRPSGAAFDPSTGFPWQESPEPPRGRQLVVSY